MFHVYLGGDKFGAAVSSPVPFYPLREPKPWNEAKAAAAAANMHFLMRNILLFSPCPQ